LTEQFSARTVFGVNLDHHWHRGLFLLAALGAHAKVRFTELLTPLGLQPAHFGVLRRLHDSEGCSQQTIADAMRLRRSVMVGLIDELESMGLVERRRHPVDRRANALYLTVQGTQVLLRADRLAAKLDEELLAPIPAEQRPGFVEHLRLLGDATGVAEGIYPTLPHEPLSFGQLDDAGRTA
jgi:DNA-binding MarR family transcriptional regulator